MPGRKPNGEIMTKDAMIEYGKQKRTTSKIYKGEAMELTNNAISQIVTRGLSELENADRHQIELSNAEMVKETSKLYIQACADTATLPSMAGLARAMGVTRSALYLWMRRKDTDTGKWLTMCQDLFSDLLSDGALKNSVNPIVSIFLQKAQYGLRDNATEISVPQDDDYQETSSGYKEKYRKLIGVEE